MPLLIRSVSENRQFYTAVFLHLPIQLVYTKPRPFGIVCYVPSVSSTALHKPMAICVVSLQRLSPPTGDHFLNVLAQTHAQTDWLEPRTHRNTYIMYINQVSVVVLNDSTTCSTFLPAALLSVNFQSCIFHPCNFVRHFPVLHFPALHFCPSFSSPAFCTIIIIIQSD